MALSTTPHPLSQREPTPPVDPFWHSTPRIGPPSLGSVMTALPQVVPGPGTPPRQATRTALRRPTCTHTTMNRVYGDHACSMCARVPEIGWVYACQQDEQPVQDFPLPLIVPCALSVDNSYLEAKAQIAKHLQMSSSVVQGIRAGSYSFEQAAQLIKQRQSLIEVIKEKECAAADSPPKPFKLVASDSSDIIASVGSSAPMQTARFLPSAGLSAIVPSRPSLLASPGQTAGPTEKKDPKCSYKVCQTCRPLFEDRMYSSFEAVLKDELPQLTKKDAQCLPVMDCNVVATFGMRQPPTPVSLESPSKDIAMCDVNETDDDISVDWTPTTQDEDSFSEHLHGVELYPCPGPHQCPVYSRFSGCAYDTGFDDGQRAANHGFFPGRLADRVTPESMHFLHKLEQSSTASSISLPTPATAPLTPLLSTNEAFSATMKRNLGKTKSADFPRVAVRTRDSKSSLGSEIEVYGGVALKEESVGRGMPDIVTDDSELDEDYPQ